MAEQNHNVKVTYKFSDITQVMEEEVKELVEKKLKGKMTSAIKKLTSNYGNDVDLKLDINLEKLENSKYNGSLIFSYNSEMIRYTPDVPFKILVDIISHAFDRFKSEILDK